jgi:hypothetical protein
MSTFITIALEGKVDLAVMERILGDFNVGLASVHGMKGKDHLRKSLKGYNQAAQRSYWTVLMDLDDDAQCAPLFAKQCLPSPAPLMCLQIAVREIEAWLMADPIQLSRFLAVPLARIPADPEAISNPKRAIVDLARQSKRGLIRKAMVPRPGSGREVGPAYETYMRDFVRTTWRPIEAERRCPSLRRYRRQLRSLPGVNA